MAATVKVEMVFEKEECESVKEELVDEQDPLNLEIGEYTESVKPEIDNEEVCEKSKNIMQELIGGFASSSASSLDSAKHSCDICEYVGPDIGSVNYHKKVKHGIKGLERHKEVIHGNIRYRCGKCDLVVSSKGALKRHIVAKHVGIRFSCDQCDFFVIIKDSSKSTSNLSMKVFVFHVMNANMLDLLREVSRGIRKLAMKI